MYKHAGLKKCQENVCPSFHSKEREKSLYPSAQNMNILVITQHCTTQSGTFTSGWKSPQFPQKYTLARLHQTAGIGTKVWNSQVKA